jgi:hypothetical protein
MKRVRFTEEQIIAVLMTGRRWRLRPNTATRNLAACRRPMALPYSAISTGCDGPASGRSSIAIMQTAVQAIMIVAAANT